MFPATVNLFQTIVLHCLEWPPKLTFSFPLLVYTTSGLISPVQLCTTKNTSKELMHYLYDVGIECWMSFQQRTTVMPTG